jgi:predicted nucleic acid-binding Zn ribbon protein
MTEQEMKRKGIIKEKDTCVCCGAYVPEGRHVCELCEQRSGEEKQSEDIKKLAIQIY